MEKTVDMSPEAVTNRMLALDGLWELSVALRSSKIVEKPAGETEEPSEKSAAEFSEEAV
jgi:hypothetical protein